MAGGAEKLVGQTIAVCRLPPARPQAPVACPTSQHAAMAAMVDPGLRSCRTVPQHVSFVGQTIVFCRLPPGTLENPLRMHPLALGGNWLGHRSLRINARVEKVPSTPVRVLAARTRHWLFFTQLRAASRREKAGHKQRWPAPRSRAVPLTAPGTGVCVRISSRESDTASQPNRRARRGRRFDIARSPAPVAPCPARCPGRADRAAPVCRL
jgi:hypothetical protein